MRVATFNLLSGRSPDAGFDVDRFTDAVREVDADLLALQEVDRDQERSGHVDLAALAAETAGATAWRFEPTLVGPPGAWAKASGGAGRRGGPAYGIAFVSRHPVTAWDVVRLPRLPGDEPRVALVATVDTPVGVWTVVSTHLTYLRPSCHLQLARLRLLVRRIAGPVLLLGDLNQGRATTELLSGLRPLATGATFPAHAPRLQLDHVLANRELPTVGGGPLRLPVSDHLALVADLAPDRAA